MLLVDSMTLPNGTWSQLDRRRLWVYSLSSIKRRMTLEFAHNVTFCRAGESASECFMSGDSLDISFGISPPVSTGQRSDPNVRKYWPESQFLLRAMKGESDSESVPAIVASIACCVFSSDRSYRNENVCSCQILFSISLTLLSFEIMKLKHL